MQVIDILARKGTAVLTCRPNDTLARVVELLVRHNIGSLVVQETDDENSTMVGIITERDLLRFAAERRGTLEETFVADRMTRDAIVCQTDDDVQQAMGLMTDHRIRHLPVFADGQLAGLLSIGDIVKAQHDELSRENHYLKSYLLG